MRSECGRGLQCQIPGFCSWTYRRKGGPKHFRLAPEQLIEVSNEWGFVLDEAAKYDFSRLLVMGHPGKLAKLAMGQWDTHSSRSTSAVPWVSDLAKETLGEAFFEEARTVEGIFALLQETDRKSLADQLSAANSSSRQQSIAETVPRSRQRSWT